MSEEKELICFWCDKPIEKGYWKYNGKPCHDLCYWEARVRIPVVKFNLNENKEE